MKITLSFATSPADLDALGDEWEELADRCPHARFFQRPGWCRAWWRAVAEGRPGYELAVAAVRDRPGVLVALAPLMVRDADGRRELCFLADPYTDYHDVLCLPGHMDSALELVWRGLRERGGWDTCALREVPMASPTADWLAGIARTVPVAELRRASTCPTLDLRDEVAYRRAVSKYEYRSKARKLAAIGPVECTHLSEPAELRRYFPEFRQMHLDQWQGRPDAVGSFDDEDVTAFFVRLIDEVGSSGGAVLTRFCVDGRPAAYYWGFRDRDCYRAYRTAYDVSLSRYSPGAVMLRHMLLDFPGSGYRTFDFMRGGYGYKSRFASGTNQNVSLELPRPAGGRRQSLTSAPATAVEHP
ncbi:GNAT family N-acetyltransferase [Streptomyces chrestomyceticus]|uniref:GNAT family N-acetyltransferase n=1 Tax=Streptomyces chrestomyceticus TaxID=68185 RepID=UPI0004C55473